MRHLAAGADFSGDPGDGGEAEVDIFRVVAQEDTLIRMAVRPCHRLPPHQ